MTMPQGVPVVDGWIGFPTTEPWESLAPLRAQFRDAESLAEPAAPVDYLFGDHVGGDGERDPVAVTLQQMDCHGIAIGLVQLEHDAAFRAVAERPDRFRGVLHVDPNDITGSVRSIRRAHEEHRIVAVYTFPAGCNPQVAVDDRRHYPIYQTCIDLDIPVVANAGIVGPRVPSWSQDVFRFDQVCYDFPELRIVMCHGAEPWEDLAVKLMLKWPGLYFMTSGFTPKHYPSAILDYANTRGADKVMYGGYFPFGLTLDRIFSELPGLPLRDGVWTKFLSENARRVFAL
jgi:predicted TIM-barrel fold metal-dependent hydrolase